MQKEVEAEHIRRLCERRLILCRGHTLVTTSAVALRTCIRLFRAMQIYLSDCGGTWTVRCKYYQFISGVLRIEIILIT